MVGSQGTSLGQRSLLCGPGLGDEELDAAILLFGASGGYLEAIFAVGRSLHAILGNAVLDE